MKSKNMLNPAHKNKRGILIGTVIFVILNIAFIALLIVYVRNSASGAGIKQTVLAKDIALFINSAKPGTIMEFDILEYKQIAEKNNIENFIRVGDGKVTVTLAKASQGASYPYFSNYKPEIKYGEAAGFKDLVWIEVKA